MMWATAVIDNQDDSDMDEFLDVVGEEYNPPMTLARLRKLLIASVNCDPSDPE